MAQIKNSGTLREIQEAGNLQSGFDQIPTEASKSVVYTMEVNPKMIRRANLAKFNTATNATSATIYTTPTNKDFYLTSAALSVIKDVTSTSINSSVVAFINGEAQALLRIAGITLTVQNDTQTLSFNYPIKIDRGTVITVTNSTNVANVRSEGCITGYLVEAQGG